MYVNPKFVEEHRREIEIEANRIHELRRDLAPDFDDPFDNWVTACNHIYRKVMAYK